MKNHIMKKKKPIPLDKPVTKKMKIIWTILWFLALFETIFVVLFQTELMVWVEPALIYIVTLVCAIAGYQSCKFIFSKQGIKKEQQSMVKGFIVAFIIATAYIWLVTDQWTFLFAMGCLILILGFFAKFLKDLWSKKEEPASIQ